MEEVTIIGVDLAKNVFQLHGAAADGVTVFRKKLSRAQFMKFMSAQSPCRVVMEACSGAHHWARQMSLFGHDVRLIAPCYVKPFVKRQKNDAADAEAIVEAAQRPNMRFVEPKSKDQQARAILFRTREQFVNQRTETVNALRAHLSEFGYVAPQGIDHLRRLRVVVEDSATDLPDLAREMCAELLSHIERLSERIDDLTRRIRIMANEHLPSRRLQTMPGVGPLTAMAVDAFAPTMQTFRRGRDFAAWLGARPAAELQRREATDRARVEARAERYPPPSGGRRNVGNPRSHAPGHCTRGVACTHFGPQAAQARGHRAGGEDGTHDLGDADEERELPGAGSRGGGMIRHDHHRRRS